MNIYEKLQQIQITLKAPKGQWNDFGKYSYRNCEDILEAVKPLLQKNKCTLTLTDTLENIGNRFYIKATATLIDCEETTQTVQVTAYAREEENKKGMDGSQVTGASSSYARKYALNGLFAIDDTKDSDTTNKGEDKPSNKTASTANNSGKLSDNQVKRLFAIANSKKVNAEAVKKIILRDYKKTNVEDLTKAEYDELCSKFENLKGE